MASTRTFRPRVFGAGLIATATGWVLTQAPDTLDVAGYGYALGVAGAATAAGTVYARFRGAAGSNRLIGRWDRNTRRNGGTASRWQMLTVSSRWSMARRAPVLRPSLRDLGWWDRWRTPALSYATPLCKVGGQTVWTSCEESTLRIGIPGTGKTAELACRVIDAPGGAVVASTATDLYDLTAKLREPRGPVTVFNPGGIGEVASTLRWSPLAGCKDPATAARRAADLIGPSGGNDEGERWNIHARRALAVMLHAAALGGYRMRDVQRWVANPDAAAAQVMTALAGSPNPAEMCQTAEQTLRMTARTRDGVMLAVAPAVAWVMQPAAAKCGDADPDTAAEFIDDLTDKAGTFYLLGDEDGTVGPLVAALTAEIVHRSRAIAAARPGGRLDPGLALILDEVALICPTPLDRWMAELRKRSIVVHAACQGLGQLRQRWGKDGASMILNAAAAVLVFGGCKDPGDLAAFCDLAGEREEVSATRDADGRVTSSTTRRVPVISAAMLAGLPNHRAMLIRRGMPVALAATPIVWRRRDVRRAVRGQTRTARAAAWTLRTVRRAARTKAAQTKTAQTKAAQTKTEEVPA
ncbi:TraM recognition domain-containing protein [Dactylosporangium roseum]|uniref:TraM recognition domain-containing protein n=1 Tax=Dactylosporangium roseum TaxID=47989 RepID=A0ABY5Z8L2_9ACTN|nr:TraM recognition domain-containing protein [Dactylosporangium roseum]UWZ37999.1 TraM recognition domain-containing protein [Dactylosporangium roseum]